ncbi:MauE/DoxX family redox-associated membrane protein [Mucilaginibacter sp. L3T2-6]|uniref:MauE/DoxX family redox-associated membrane protein n=1 Tax=Mucilaginibacter sp. L3T2-6 TaxID=3062491 RepID=UPI002675A961|nr:MauE/DoxX family redox-associated membrane protein [Mucilaginibacter sp. L3T2-6]MDO3643503.1 hypothetical protein [Mucilaginibacter sp. L3T2-6]MDV6215954.1 hypothetical protein [Mucilaginibacter sp. L3T2-6]
MLQNKEIALRKTIEIIVIMISILWLYAAVSKLVDFSHFKDAMKKQPFGEGLQNLLIYGLPPMEILTGVLLLTEKGKLTGLYISAILFTAFTIYILLIILKFFGHVPCSCGGLIGQMGWTFHFWFILFFLTLTGVSIITIIKRKEYRNT